MISLRIFKSRISLLFAAALLMLSTAVPSMVMAATVTARSIALSSSVKSATDVDYQVKFTIDAASASTGAFVVDFCTTAVIDSACTAPTDFDSSAVTTATAGYSVAALGVSENAVVVTITSPVSGGGNVDVTLSDIVNPSVVDTMYARIVTYANATDAGNYASNDIDNGGSNVHIDDGGVAIAITDGFDVSGRVAETLVFCVSGTDQVIGSGCSTNVDPASLNLGGDSGLSTTPSTGTIKTQISTNAVGGATVYMKSDATGCGGLLREGTGSVASRCGIAPIVTPNTTATISGAFFGLKLANLGGASSTTTAVEASSYDTANFYMGYDSGDATGVTGPYGDPLYNTSSAPVADGTADLTFGAAIDALTPAGNYKAAFNLIATGTF